MPPARRDARLREPLSTHERRAEAGVVVTLLVGDALHVVDDAAPDVRILNLETSITSSCEGRLPPMRRVEVDQLRVVDGGDGRDHVLEPDAGVSQWTLPGPSPDARGLGSTAETSIHSRDDQIILERFASESHGRRCPAAIRTFHRQPRRRRRALLAALDNAVRTGTVTLRDWRASAMCMARCWLRADRSSTAMTVDATHTRVRQGLQWLAPRDAADAMRSGSVRFDVRTPRAACRRRNGARRRV